MVRIATVVAVARAPLDAYGNSKFWDSTARLRSRDAKGAVQCLISCFLIEKCCTVPTKPKNTFSSNLQAWKPLMVVGEVGSNLPQQKYTTWRKHSTTIAAAWVSTFEGPLYVSILYLPCKRAYFSRNLYEPMYSYQMPRTVLSKGA